MFPAAEAIDLDLSHVQKINTCTMKPPKIKGIFHGTYLINHGWPWYILYVRMP